jgi:hypothetical protein
MQESNDEIARRVLASVLERLEASGSPRPEDLASTTASRPLSGSDPVVIVVLGQAGAGSTRSEAPRPLNETSTQVAGSSRTSFIESAQHGLEKFELPKPSPNTGAPKSCFMEPDRPCVNSGACEMRGY